MAVSEVGATSSGEGSAGAGVQVLPLRTGPTEIDNKAIPAATLVIRVKDQAGQETHFKLNVTTRMEKLFNAFAARKGVPMTSLRFLLDGVRVAENDTSVTLELEDQDTIDCMLEQPWTGPWTSFTRACLLPGYALQQQAQAGERNEGASRAAAAAAAAPAGRAETKEGHTEVETEIELLRRALDALTKMPTSVQTALEEVKKRSADLEQAQSKLERRTLLVMLTPLFMFPLALWVVAAAKEW